MQITHTHNDRQTDRQTDEQTYMNRVTVHILLISRNPVDMYIKRHRERRTD